MISTPDRRRTVELIDEAVRAGARKAPACRLLGLSVRTVQRWRCDGDVGEDRRPNAERPVPTNALSEAERGAVLAVCNSPEHASLPPSQIVPRLADQGTYLASESTFYRILRDADLAIEPGERVALVGAAGYGSSTLLDILYGVREPRRGTVRIDGVALDDSVVSSITGYFVLWTLVFLGGTVRGIQLPLHQRQSHQGLGAGEKNPPRVAQVAIL
mgnify:CR=1 FL=1